MNLFTAKKLTELRKYSSLSQEALAEKIGVSRQAVSKWERGEASPDTENLLALSKIYSVSLDDLLGEKSAEEIICAMNEKSELPQEPVTENETKTQLYSNAVPNTEKTVSTQTGATERLPEAIKKELADLPALGKKMLRFPFFLIAIIGYLAIGFSIKVWHPTWLIFIALPAYYITAVAFLQKTEKKMLLTLPVYLYAVIAFLIVGLALNLWHPAWLVFLAIPAYYWFVATKK